MISFFIPVVKKLRKLKVSPLGDTFLPAFCPKRVPLNREASNFGSTVLEGFYELSKILETSTSTIGKVHVSEISGPSVAGAWSNRL